MTSLESLVPPLSLCRQLQAAGFPQDTAMVWTRVGYSEPWHVMSNDHLDRVLKDNYEKSFLQPGHIPLLKAMDLVAAPTAEEILKELPDYLGMIPGDLAFITVKHSADGFRVAWRTWNNFGEWPCDDGNKYYEKESEAAAAAYLWWKNEVAG